jgi:hypothetical protein
VDSRASGLQELAFDVKVSSGEIDSEVRRRIRAGEPIFVFRGN